MISGREAYGAYTTFATETAILAITVAKSPFFLPYDDGYSVICNISDRKDTKFISKAIL